VAYSFFLNKNWGWEKFSVLLIKVAPMTILQLSLGDLNSEPGGYNATSISSVIFVTMSIFSFSIDQTMKKMGLVETKVLSRCHASFDQIFFM
jgi:K+ transporter